MCNAIKIYVASATNLILVLWAACKANKYICRFNIYFVLLRSRNQAVAIADTRMRLGRVE
jgi:hypothetical protein